jgi:hypothetical protein
MKAYKVYVRGDEENCAYVGGETAGKAKYSALKTTHGRKITDLSARRAPEMDDIARYGPLTSAEALDSYDCEFWGRPVRFS